MSVGVTCGFSAPTPAPAPVDLCGLFAQTNGLIYRLLHGDTASERAGNRTANRGKNRA